MTRPTAWTLFVSHASIDKPTARQIRDALALRGVEVWLDEAEIRVGDSIPERVQTGLRRSDALALLVSDASAQSPWVAREFNAFAVRMINEGKPIYPCRLDDTEVPPLVADLLYADFRHSIDHGVQQLLKARLLAQQAKVNTSARDSLQKLRDSISGEAWSWTIAFLREGYHVGDRRTERHPYQLLRHLKGLGLADYEPDRYEQAWEPTPVGRRVLELLGENGDVGD